VIGRLPVVALVTAACVGCGVLLVRHFGLGVAQNEYGQLIEYPGKREMPRPIIGPRTLVAFTFGQSNSANSGSQRYRAATRKVLNYFDGRYFLAEDPLLGAWGVGGGVWTLAANKLVATKAFDQVILLAAGIAATSVQDWTTGGRLNGMLEARLADAKAAGLTVTHFLWHQGEADNSDAGVAGYDAAMRPIIALTKRYFPQSKFFVAQATLCTRSPGPNAALRKVQFDLARIPGVYAGPNTDDIGFDGRFDDCHMNGIGLEKHAEGWAAALAAPLD
jgi:Carbohydrate esterase, sialic acid-specific acetylesterase